MGDNVTTPDNVLPGGHGRALGFHTITVDNTHAILGELERAASKASVALEVNRPPVCDSYWFSYAAR